MVFSSSCTYISLIVKGSFKLQWEITFFSTKENMGHMPSYCKRTVMIFKLYRSAIVIMQYYPLKVFIKVLHTRFNIDLLLHIEPMGTNYSDATCQFNSTINTEMKVWSHIVKILVYL